MGSGTANWRNSIDGYGNYWSDWTMPDDDHDRMVDTPNELAGAAGTSGEYPRTTAVTPIPEFSSAGIANL